MAAPTIIARLMPFFLLLSLVLTRHSHALTHKEGRPGDLSDEQAQRDAINIIIDSALAHLDYFGYYSPGPITAATSELAPGLRLHTRFILYDTGACFGEGVGGILGSNLIDAFLNHMLYPMRTQVRNAFGFGVVVEGADDQNLLQAGLSAQVYYWIERTDGSNPGGDTPNTKQGEGPSDNNPSRHDELSSITGIANENRSFRGVNNTSHFLKRTQPPNHIKYTKTNNVSVGTKAQKDRALDCPPYEYALFTSLYDINVITSQSSHDGYPSRIYSPNKVYTLVMQNDCNLVLYKFKKPIWACGDKCYYKGLHCFARINLDGTFAVYDGDGNPLMYTPTQCSSGSGCWSDTYLAMQDDGNLVLYLSDTNFPIWATGTNT